MRAGELRLEPRLLLTGPPTIGGNDVQAPIPPTRGFHAGPGEIPFECRTRVGFPCEPLDEFRLARRRGSERGGGAVLRLLIRRCGVGHSLLQRGVCDSVFRHDRVVPCLERRELRPGDRQV